MTCLFRRCDDAEKQRIWAAKVESARSAFAERGLLRVIVMFHTPEAQMEEIGPLSLDAMRRPMVVG